MNKFEQFHEKEDKILRFIVGFRHATNRYPSIPEISQAVGLESFSTVQACVEDLIYRGELSKAIRNPSGITVLIVDSKP